MENSRLVGGAVSRLKRLVLMDDATSISPVQRTQARTNILLGETTGPFSFSAGWNENFATGYDSLEPVSTHRNCRIQPSATLGGVSHALHTTRSAGLSSSGSYINALTEFADLSLKGSSPMALHCARRTSTINGPSKLARTSSQGAVWNYPSTARIDRAPP